MCSKMGAKEIFQEVSPIPCQQLRERVELLLGDLLQRRNRPELEQFRFHGSTNRVYRIPLGLEGGVFIIVKLLPSPWIDLRNHFKGFLRNLIYGEHDVFTRSQRSRMELERAREWQKEGLPVPPLIGTSLPEVRVFLGLPFPTVFTILSNDSLESQLKLQAVQAVVQSLSQQHQTALERGKKSLVHRDPGPWNVMFDWEKGRCYWYDLEHPADYPQMDLEGLMVRAVRIFLYGVLQHLGDQSDEVIKIVVRDYELKNILWKLARQMEQPSPSYWRYLLQRMAWRRTFHSRTLIGRKIRLCLETGTPEREAGLWSA